MPPPRVSTFKSRNRKNFHFENRIKDHHFNRWLGLFNATVDEYFEGAKAKGAKDRALSIATIIKMKIDNLEKERLEINN